MNKVFIFLALAGFGEALCSWGQDGRLTEKVALEFPEAARVQIETNFPGTREILKSVQLHRITYLSDGLKVTGYLAGPKAGQRLPCVIYNRGAIASLERGAMDPRPQSSGAWRVGAMWSSPASIGVTPEAKAAKSLVAPRLMTS